MSIVNVGSINWDRVFRVPHFPQPGETLAARSGMVGLGGKGLNQSVAIARAGGKVLHVGAVGAGDLTIGPALQGVGLDLGGIAQVTGVETGSALILVDDTAENLIVLDQGANHRLDEGHISSVLAGYGESDWLLMQNETNGNLAAIKAAKARGMKIALAAAPFEADAVLPLLDDIDLLSVNEVEFAQLTAAMPEGRTLPERLWVLISLGANGAKLQRPEGEVAVPAFRVTPVDTTGAGDTAFGAFMARLDLGEAPEEALRFAMAAAAIAVTRAGAVPAIPEVAEVLTFLAAQG